jgi:hypothetical protein
MKELGVIEDLKYVVADKRADNARGAVKEILPAERPA